MAAERKLADGINEIAKKAMEAVEAVQAVLNGLACPIDKRKT